MVYDKIIVGQTYTSSKGLDFVVKEVNSATNIVVRFLEPFQYTTKTTAYSIRKRIISNPMEKTIAGIGFIGVGKYSSSRTNIGNSMFERWYSIFRRVHLETSSLGNKSYHDASICEEWHNFQNFAQWMVDQNLQDKSWHLDKDLLVKGNKTYGPDTCIFLPGEVNVFFTQRKTQRGSTPMGVHYRARTGMYLACFTRNSKSHHIGCYHTPEEAFTAYKGAKEAQAKVLAEKWKDLLDPRAFQALMSYEVLITD
jgi:hypothetical protein